MIMGLITLVRRSITVEDLPSMSMFITAVKRLEKLPLSGDLSLFWRFIPVFRRYITFIIVGTPSFICKGDSNSRNFKYGGINNFAQIVGVENGC
jgi:hypothetical protein